MTAKDYSNLEFKVFAGEGTLLLNQYTEITGTNYFLSFTDKYNSSIKIDPEAVPTEAQRAIYHGNREFVIPVFNRDQQVIVRFLTTVREAPNLWLDTLHQGVTLKFRQIGNHVFGVPVKLALSIGLSVCFIILILSILLISEAWIASVVSMAFGLFAQAIGAFCYRFYRAVTKILIG